MAKVDHKKRLGSLYAPSAREVSIVEVPPMNFLMADGAGDPNASKPFREAVEALFALSYALKFMVKKGPAGIDYAVMPLEGLWWMEGGTAFDPGNKAKWRWTLMIAQPAPVTAALAAAAREQAGAKRELPALAGLRFAPFEEGTAIQVLHVGPFAEEEPTIQRLHRFAGEHGYRLRGKHHEIYLSDFRKVAPAKMKTLIRQPVEKA